MAILPADVTSKCQVINFAASSDHKQFALPVSGELATPTFSLEALALKRLLPLWRVQGWH